MYSLIINDAISTIKANNIPVMIEDELPDVVDTIMSVFEGSLPEVMF